MARIPSDRSTDEPKVEVVHIHRHETALESSPDLNPYPTCNCISERRDLIQEETK